MFLGEDGLSCDCLHWSISIHLSCRGVLAGKVGGLAATAVCHYKKGFFSGWASVLFNPELSLGMTLNETKDSD